MREEGRYYIRTSPITVGSAIERPATNVNMKAMTKEEGQRNALPRHSSDSSQEVKRETNTKAKKNETK
jgi:hypothetical protein